MKFQVGDLVEVVNMDIYPDRRGWTGTVIEVGGCIGVRHSKSSAKLHNCQGNCPDGYGWYYDSQDLELLWEEEPETEIDIGNLL